MAEFYIFNKKLKDYYISSNSNSNLIKIYLFLADLSEESGMWELSLFKKICDFGGIPIFLKIILLFKESGFLDKICRILLN